MSIKNVHFFVANIVHKDNHGNYLPCHMNVNVKRNAEGDWFYSFAIEKGSVPQTLLAAGADKSATLPNQRVAQPNETVKRQFSVSSAENVKKAEAYFGTTCKNSEVGCLLTDGRLRDFSGKHEDGCR